MPRYFFDSDDGDRRIHDAVGIELPDIGCAEAEVIALLRDLTHSDVASGRRVVTASVRDEADAEVCRGEMTIVVRRV